jgi:hypothetical protein
MQAQGEQRKAEQAIEQAKADQQKAEQAIEQAKADQQKAQEQAERTSAARMRAAQTSVEEAWRLRKRTQLLEQLRAEQDARVHDQEAENHKHMLELMELARKHAQLQYPDHLERQLEARITLLEQMRRHTLSTQHETLAGQYRELAAHYERLAAEQRKLAEEIERAQQESAPGK